MKKEERVLYIAALRQPHHKDKLVVDVCSSCLDDVDKEQVLRFASHKLRNINEAPTNFLSLCSNHMGMWAIKGVNGVTYVVVTSHQYPQDVAMECLDEFSDAYEQVSKIWLAKRRRPARAVCCQAIFDKYTSVEVETAPWFLMNSVDRESRREYSRSVKNLFEKVSKLEKQMNDNIINELENMESAESLQELANDCFEKAAVFRKKAKQVRMQTQRKNRLFVASGVAVSAAVGGVVGFMAGGPGGAVALTAMSVAEAQAIEAGVAAIIFGVGFYVAQRKVENWSWRQPIRIL